MAFIEGATFSGYFSELTTVQSVTSGASGSSTRRHAPRLKSQANTNRAQTNTGAAIRRYQQELSILFGGDDF